MTKKIKKIAIWSTIYLQFIITPAARAATSSATGLLGDIKEKTKETAKAAGFGDVKRDPRESIAIMINGLLGLMGIIFTILIIYAGWQWMTAGGNEEQVAKAKKTLNNATIGLLLVIVAYALTVWIFKIINQAIGDTKPSP